MSNSISNQIEQQYPLHYYIWKNDFKKLKDILSSPLGQKLIEKRDIRGRTPLMLAVTLGHFEISKLLMNLNANVDIDDDHGFNVLHEAISSNDPELVQLVLEKRDSQRTSIRLKAIPQLLRKIRDTPDFYVEMKWEFTSWVPLLARVCPSDTYKIYKSGSKVRVDTTLSGFEQMNWQRGSRTYIFTATDQSAKFYDINHDNRQVHIDKLELSDLTNEVNNFFQSTPDVMAQARLTCPTSITYLDTDNIIFERCKQGFIPGFRSDRTEIVNGYECKVFTANNVQLITKTRTEHLSEEDKKNYYKQAQANTIPFQSLLNTVEIIDKNYTDEEKLSNIEQINNFNLSKISLEQYFDPNYPIKGHDIGRPREMHTKINKFKSHLWLSEKFELSLQEQILPIIDLMSISSAHFKKLKNFITLQLPSGFPVKIEIPLFHIVNAKITFGNLFSLNEPVDKVTPIKDETTTACVIDETAFKIPENYSYLGNDDYEPRNDDDYDLALQRYISNDRLHKINGTNSNYDYKDTEMQKAIAESIKTYNINQNRISLTRNQNHKLIAEENDDLETAIQLSLKENEFQKIQNNKKNNEIAEEIDDLEIAIQLSLKENEFEKIQDELEKEYEKVLKLSLIEK